jgi:hypothetical protein
MLHKATSYVSGCRRCQDGDGRHGCPPRCAWARVFARITEVASRDLLNFLPATGRTYLLSSTTSVNHRGPPSLPRAELGTNGLTGWDHACLEMSRFPAFWAPEMPENVLASVQLTTFAVSGVAR